MKMEFSLGPVSALAGGTGRRFDFGDHRVAVFSIEEDIYAIGDRCSHAEASLAEGEVFDREVECPRHGSSFDLASGRPVTLPATKPVPVYTVITRDREAILVIATEEDGQ